MEDKGYGIKVKKICEEYRRNNPKASDDEVSLLREVSESFYRKKPEQRKKILETRGMFQNFEKFRKVFEEHD
ncbi:hypothetical protein M0R72_04430 [Candidatus Pacearchaeota archaeon]|jgi:hypothetical protein|nr:hypothetical protein [Candidatus Pacearchaeota archaeon]